MAKRKRKSKIRVYIGPHGSVLKTDEPLLKKKIEPMGGKDTVVLEDHEIELISKRVAEILGDKLMRNPQTPVNEGSIVKRTRRRMIEPTTSALNPQEIRGNIEVEKAESKEDIEQAVKTMEKQDDRAD